MPRESEFTALVIKKQALGEADEIVTLFSREEGKLRAVSKSSKLSTSKLQYSLQPMFLVDVAISGKTNLPKLIRANTKNAYPNLHADPVRISLWFVVAELVIRLLPDNQPNEGLYDLTLTFLNFLDGAEPKEELLLETALLKYKIAAMELTGLGIHEVSEYVPGQTLLFSPSRGGFYYDSSSGRGGADSTTVPKEIWEGFRDLKNSDWASIPESENWLKLLSKLISTFTTYQLEREIKSERFL